MVINALKKYNDAIIGVLGERKKFFCMLLNEEESIASWESKIHTQAAQCEYETFADELMRDQFTAGLASEPLLVIVIRKSHWHTDTLRSKVTLREFIE